MGTPTIGRIVYSVGPVFGSEGIVPAIITNVFGEHPDGGYTVNLTAFPDGSAPVVEGLVRLVDDEDTARKVSAECGRAAYWPNVGAKPAPAPEPTPAPEPVPVPVAPVAAPATEGSVGL